MERFEVELVNEHEDVSELEPMVLAQITEVTSGGAAGSDGDTIVWGSFE
jgi:hypothetical protein